MNEPKELNYSLTEAKAEIVNGERSQKAIVNQEEKGSVTNTITVNEVKDIAKTTKEEATELTPKEKEWVSENTSKKLVAVYEVDNIKNIHKNVLDNLKCGDVVVKITHQNSRKMYHCYIVSYYEHKHGCCLTYTAAGYIETQSYDYTEGHWVYNSEDKWQAE